MTRLRQKTFHLGLRLLLVLLIGLLLSGCFVRLVPPYDEKLVTDTEAVYKKASSLIDKGITTSPRTDEDRARLQPPDKSESHFSKFEAAYDALITDANALILRALASNQEVSPIGSSIQKAINTLIDEALPTSCDQLDRELGAAASSLTVKNYVDLECFFVRWKDQHADAQFTRGSQILKRANWEGRKSALFNAILAIQKAEAFKKP